MAERLVLTREVLQSGRVRDLVSANDPELCLLSETEREAGRRQLLAERPPGEDVWLFAYGSLMWNPVFEYAEQVRGTVRGYHRRYCLWVRLGRGSPENPGLMLGLEPGGTCHGVVYRIAAERADTETAVVWQREMLSGAYRPRWVDANTAAGRRRCIAFAMNRAHPRYAGRLCESRVVDVVATAHGVLGACHEYLFATTAHLESLGLTDSRLFRIRDRVRARLGEPAAPVARAG